MLKRILFVGFIFLLGLPLLAQDRVCQQQGYATAVCPFCGTKRVKICANSGADGWCCVNQGETVPCASGCGSVMQSSVCATCTAKACGTWTCLGPIAYLKNSRMLAGLTTRVMLLGCDNQYHALSEIYKPRS